MTKEEAIKMLKSKLDGHTDTSWEWTETVRMAILALEIINKIERFADIPESYTVFDTPLTEKPIRKFEEIMVEYPPAELCAYPEYRGKPYFSIKFEENGEHVVGFGTYKPEVLSEYLRDYFIKPSAEKTAEWVYRGNSIICSNCEEKIPYGIHNHYCRNCGAKMKESEGNK